MYFLKIFSKKPHFVRFSDWLRQLIYAYDLLTHGGILCFFVIHGLELVMKKDLFRNFHLINQKSGQESQDKIFVLLLPWTDREQTREQARTMNYHSKKKLPGTARRQHALALFPENWTEWVVDGRNEAAQLNLNVEE